MVSVKLRKTVHNTFPIRFQMFCEYLLTPVRKKVLIGLRTGIANTCSKRQQKVPRSVFKSAFRKVFRIMLPMGSFKTNSEMFLKRFGTVFRTLPNSWPNKQWNVFGTISERFHYFPNCSLNNETVRNIFRNSSETFLKSFQNGTQTLSKATMKRVRKAFRNALGNLDFPFGKVRKPFKNVSEAFREILKALWNVSE